MSGVSNVELALLEMVAEKQPVSGYEIDTLIRQRGYREWAGIGTTSIYIRLLRLEKRGLIEARAHKKKSGRGPAPKKYALTAAGERTVKPVITDALIFSRSMNPRFDLGMAGLPLLTGREAITSLQKRIKFLKRVSSELKVKYLSQGGDALPAHVGALFGRPVYMAGCEIKFLNILIKKIKADKRGGPK